MKKSSKLQSNSIGVVRGEQVEKLVIKAFTSTGWRIPKTKANRKAPDCLIVKRSGITYLIDIKVSSEGRKDRLIPLWSQTFLQSSCLAGADQKPLAIVAAPKIAQSVAQQVIEFAAQYAPHAAVGVIDLNGLRMFHGPFLEDLNSAGDENSRMVSTAITAPTNLFSDLNQWMLKVLLAPEIPEELLTAPRKSYHNPTELAEAANVSKMSAFRLIQQLREENYIDDATGYLKLVRRSSFFQRWQSAVQGTAKELPLRFIFKSNPLKDLLRIFRSQELCLGLFAAADALNYGFVSGVPLYIYVPRLNLINISKWKNIIPPEPSELPDLFVRQPSACQSVFRGAVKTNGLYAADILQTWLDVSAHPSRGQEQADLIRRRVLAPIIEGEK